MGKEWEVLFFGERDDARCALLLVTCQEGKSKNKNSPQSGLCKKRWIKAKQEVRCWNPVLRGRVRAAVFRAPGLQLQSSAAGGAVKITHLSLSHSFPCMGSYILTPSPTGLNRDWDNIRCCESWELEDGGVTKLNIGKERKRKADCRGLTGVTWTEKYFFRLLLRLVLIHFLFFLFLI